MLTGQRLFKGDDVADTLAAVLRAEPDWTALPAETPPSIRRLLRRCLEKDPKQRLQHIGDARLELADAGAADAAPIVAASPARGWWRLAAAAVAGAAAAAVVAWMRSPPAPARAVTRFAIQASDLAPRAIGTGSSLALSPDGQTIVYVVSGTGPGLVRRRLDDLTAEPIRGTEGGSRPFFSPDGRSIGFFADGQLKTRANRGRHTGGAHRRAGPGARRLGRRRHDCAGSSQPLAGAGERRSGADHHRGERRDRAVPRSRRPAGLEGGAGAEPPAAQPRVHRGRRARDAGRATA